MPFEAEREQFEQIKIIAACAMDANTAEQFDFLLFGLWDDGEGCTPTC